MKYTPYLIILLFLLFDLVVFVINPTFIQWWICFFTINALLSLTILEGSEDAYKGN